MQVRMDIPGSLELAEFHGRRLLEIATTSPDLARQLAKPHYRLRISRIRQAAYSAGERMALAESVIARNKLQRLA